MRCDDVEAERAKIKREKIERKCFKSGSTSSRSLLRAFFVMLLSLYRKREISFLTRRRYYLILFAVRMEYKPSLWKKGHGSISADLIVSGAGITRRVSREGPTLIAVLVPYLLRFDPSCWLGVLRCQCGEDAKLERSKH